MKLKISCEEPESCLACGICVRVCPKKAITIDRKAGILKINTELCDGESCKICIEKCPMRILVLGEQFREWRFPILEKKHKKKFFGNLLEEVIKPAICSHCTACSAICPVKGITAGDKPIDFPNWLKDCVDCGACVKVCPRWDYKPLNGIGNYIEIFSAKSKRFTGQDGAMVTEFTATALEENIIEKAIFVARDEEWRTRIVTITEPEQLKDTKITGTKYTFADVLPAVKEAILDSKAIAFVGTPCMISALRRMQKAFKKFERVKLAI
ncbi:MAG: coenzyme F420 hydrogenase/dehydrogenase beta subunit N-terminal domain-containing protein, partial [Archaeoglobaceae archaeon]